VATLYAAGYSPADIQRFHEGLHIRQLLKRVPGEGPGLFGLRHAKEAFRRLLGERTFADLQIPLALTSVDLTTGQARLLTEGGVLEALMIAVAIPGLFPPTRRGVQMLLDGGALHPVPVAAARALAPDCPVIAVVLSPPYAEWARHPFPNLLHSVPLLRHIARWRWVEAFNIYVRTMDLTQRMLAELRLETEHPELVIRPPVDHVGLFDAVNIEEMVHVGEAAAQKSLLRFAEKVGNFEQTGLQYPQVRQENTVSNGHSTMKEAP
jgi:NTE family protein